MSMATLPFSSALGLVNKLEDTANQIYQHLPSAETVLSASIATGAGLATGGIGAAGIGLGYCVV
ncbi:hypothetical protein D5018_21385, partial [Parashewanella curva]